MVVASPVMHLESASLLTISQPMKTSFFNEMLPASFQGKPFNITVIQAYAPTSNAEEAEVEGFYETYKTF